MLRTLADGAERTFPDVVEFTLTERRQATRLCGLREGHVEERRVRGPHLGSADAAAPLLAGKGKYIKLTWDENQTELAFLSSHDDADAKQPKWKLYGWDRQAPAASVLASSETPGFRKEFAISDKGNLSFSKDGTRVFFALRAAGAREERRRRHIHRRQGRGGSLVV